jgi:hypothetical protein
VTNASSQTHQDLLPLVSLSHCTCTANTLFPSGTLQERDSTSNFWQTIAGIDVTLEALPRHDVIGRTPAASAAIDIQPGQPPA